METKTDIQTGEEPLLPSLWRVQHTTRDTQDVVTLVIEPVDATRRPEIRPGQFHMLYVFGVGEVPISFAGSQGERGVVHSIRDVGAVTHALCQLGPGGSVGVRGPFGTEWPIAEQQGRDLIIAAGGIGIAPVRPIVETVLHRREAFDDVVVLYGARTPADLLYTDEFHRWRKAGIQVEVTVDSGSVSWPGHVGVVTTLIRHAKFEVDEAAAFLCGPEIMMRFMAHELISRGVDQDRVFLTMERNMKCAIGFCGHCQLGPEFVCMDGPVFPWPRMEPWIAIPCL